MRRMLFLLLALNACSSSDGGSGGGGGNDILDSNECKAYCGKVAYLGCGATCDQAAVCTIPAGSCAAAVKAKLDCEVKTGSWACQSGGYSVAYSCSNFHELCSGDADGGTDGGTDASDAH